MICLSVIIPAYNEQARIIKTLNEVNQFLQHRPYKSEIVIVENGSTDQTTQLVNDYINQHQGLRIRMLNLPTGDKGQAVRSGMLVANGRMRYMADADLSTPIWAVEDFIYTMKRNGADIVIGHRNNIIGQTITRGIMSLGFAAATKLVLGQGIIDTQAGFKLFTAEAAERIFPILKVMGWAFDVEVLFLAKQMGMEIQQMPITWERQPGSKVKLFDPLRMLFDLIKITRGNYEIGN